MRYHLMSIDAWRNTEGWDWNNWFARGEVDHDELVKPGTGEFCNRRIISAVRRATGLRMEGMLSVEFSGTDPELITICDKGTGEPIYAIQVDYE